jgi:dolichol-phosphate mannosyltransferase
VTKLGVVITTLNEAGTIGATVKALLDMGRGQVPVYVVDAASTDNTVQRAAAAGAVTQQLALRMPIGPSLMAGWKMALLDGCDLIGQMDAGGSHRPMDLMFAAYRLGVPGNANEKRMVVGSRFLGGSRRASYKGRLWRNLASRGMAVLCNALTFQRLSDWTSGLRVFTAPLVYALLTYEYQAGMHGWQIEVLYRALRCGADVREVGIDYVAGRSSMNRRVTREALRVVAGLRPVHGRSGKA